LGFSPPPNMQVKKNYTLFTALLFIACVCIAVVLVITACTDRNKLISFIVRVSGRPYLLNILQQQIITPAKFRLIKTGSYILLAADLAVMAGIYYYRKKISVWLQFFRSCFLFYIKAVVSVFKQNSKQNNRVFVLLLAVITTRAIYYLLHFELQYDEMWSYNYFTSRPFYFTVFSYNNYPLYQLSTQLFKWLPFSMKVNLRLPVLLAGISACIILYACTKKSIQGTSLQH